jgi:hypothetical protein
MSTAKRTSCGGGFVLASLFLSLAMSCAHDMQQVPPVAVDWKAVEQALGKPGSAQPGDVYKFGLPRTDLTVQVGTVTIKPTLALEKKRGSSPSWRIA